MGSRRISMIVKKITRQLLPTYDEPPHNSRHSLMKNRMTSSSLVLKMEPSAFIPWILTLMKRCLRGVHSQYGILHSHRMDNGLR